ncbi:MAG: hypothetical protein U0Q03_01665 [Acidimicrobiales bacterium]
MDAQLWFEMLRGPGLAAGSWVTTVVAVLAAIVAGDHGVRWERAS